MKRSCEFCGGSGQLSFFQGVSRFLLTWEECPECGGTGFALDHEGDEPDQPREEQAQKERPAPE